MQNCTRETKLATILYIRPAVNGTAIKRPIPVTIEQIDAIPEVADALVIFNDESLTKDARIEAMRFMSDRVQDFMFNYIYTKSNAVPVCSKYFNLPGYSEMHEIVSRNVVGSRA